MNKNECLKDFLICPTCKMRLDPKYLGERCPRCNSIVRFSNCDNCQNKCR